MKKLFLLIPLLFLTGCTINYELVIDKDEIRENITGIVTKEESITDKKATDINLFDYFTHYDQNVFYNNSDIFYKKELDDKGEYYNYNASYTYVDNFKDSNIINSCFEKHEITDDEDFYNIHLSGSFSCLYTDKININVKSNMAVIKNNADNVNGNVYSWVIDDSENIDIELAISKNIEQFTSTRDKSILTPYQIITFILLIILIIISFIIYKKRNSD